jgi:hypothetical protein
LDPPDHTQPRPAPPWTQMVPGGVKFSLLASLIAQLVGPPVLGSLVWSAEGLPSTRNWPFLWPLSPTSPPQVIPKAM